ncbi:ABC transporter substrate-binding protein [Arthrobacter sp. UM1]|uniref:ABC transporter substrate-binding protein n=1 Tax=Arthrobacter sp. UM1 TaxID=2766776 RepID=UPI001CF6BC23|nr:ABC transporter substrate-binding protein [Arthrobacter sp. UM1]MCB4207276.1 hypothetical protein [Arthrobacter sp. UM1]
MTETPAPRRSTERAGSPVSRRRALGLAALAASAPALAGCAPKVEPPSSGARLVERRLRFGLPAPVFTLDPAVADDIESQRVIRQCVQTLIGTDPATGASAPRLATSYRLLDGGTSVELRLRSGVEFHDGSRLTAAAVRDTFERLYHLPREVYTAHPSNDFRSLFRAHAGEARSSLYVGCDILAEDVVVLKTTERIAGLVPALSQIGFGILSPAQTKARRAEGAGLKTAPQDFTPSGTGPFAVSRVSEKGVSLTRFQKNQSTPIAATGIDFSVHPDEWERLSALMSGKIDAFDLVTPRMAATLARNAQHLQTRDPYSLLYLGMNAAHPALKSRQVRQLVAQIVTKQQLVSSQFLSGTKIAESFFPPRLGVNNKLFTDPEVPLTQSDAQDALHKAGYRGEEVEFVYPTGSPRIYLPYPEKAYAIVARQLQAAGINIKPVPIPWSEGFTTQMLRRRSRGFHLMGLNGGFLDPGYFVNALFMNAREEFGLDSPELTSRLSAALAIADPDDRLAAYEKIGNLIAHAVPAVPLVVPVSALASAPDVNGLPASPVLDEVFSGVRFS